VRSATERPRPEKPIRSSIYPCPGWNDAPCGTAIRRDQDICGLCRQEKRAAECADGLPPELPVPELEPAVATALPDPPTYLAPAPARAPRVLKPEAQKLHWARCMPCGRLGSLTPVLTPNVKSVTCGRCLRMLAQQPALRLAKAG
jgi:hypothetical protein